MAIATMPTVSTSGRNGTHSRSSQDEPSALLTIVSPQMACDWLATAHPNRPVSRARVRTIARAIKAGAWQTNGQTLVLCPDFRLLDGRHRCMAIVEAGRSVETFVVAGIHPQCFLSMDQGKKRSAADLLQTAGHKQAQTLASALRWYWRYEHQQMLSATIPVADYELPAYLAQHANITTSLSWGFSLKALLPAGCASVLHFLMSAHDAALAKLLFLGLASGLELTAADPVYMVRERYICQGRALNHTAVVERAAGIVRAWQALRGGRPMPAGKFVGGSAQFPTIE
ncbi:MAG TPA: hypothetical protein VLQ80_25355 [Candidatus Saccharimonadia bacterium]|nr:hypothetical protein [Candidatus Saccharimonadia bacterium]